MLYPQTYCTYLQTYHNELSTEYRLHVKLFIKGTWSGYTGIVRKIMSFFR